MMSTHLSRLVLVCVLPLSWFASPVTAADLSINVERIENCLSFSENPFTCIGEAAGGCSNLPSGGTVEGMTTCVDLERGYWIEYSEHTMAVILEQAAIADKHSGTRHGKTSLVDAVTEMHMGWQSFRDATCRVKGERYEESALIEGKCLMEQDGDQALYLQSILDEDF